MHRVVLIAIVLWLTSCGSGSGLPGEDEPLLNQAPTLTIPRVDFVRRRSSASYPVEAVDPEGEPVRIVMLSEEPGITFHPRRSMVTGHALAELRINAILVTSMNPVLRFRAIDAAGNVTEKRLTFQADFQPEGDDKGALMRYADVTGDGRADLIVGSPRWRPGASGDFVGRVYVWPGSQNATGAAPITLVTAAQLPGSMTGHQLRLCDVTGDGIVDVVSVGRVADGEIDGATVTVWKGGALSGVVTPHAELVLPWTAAQLRDQDYRCKDVTGDGTPDIVVHLAGAEVGGTANVGRILVFEGGAKMVGRPAPRATLQPASRDQDTQLGSAGLLLVDVTGDATCDVVAVTPGAHRGAVVGDGAVYVWTGSASLRGAPAPAVLRAPTAQQGTTLGYDFGREVSIANVVGSAKLDIVVAAPLREHDGLDRAGEIFVWAGGMLTGTPAPTATLRAPRPEAGMRLGKGFPGLPPRNFPERFDCGVGLQCADVTGNGYDDVVALGLYADRHAGDIVITDAGALFVWEGGASMTGTPTAKATLQSPASFGPSRFGNDVLFFDITGDETLDVLVSDAGADLNDMTDTGALLLWTGGTGLTGTPAPATLAVLGAAAGDALSSGIPFQIRCTDVTGDHRRDVIALARDADLLAAPDGGACYLWTGAPSMTGTRTQDATLRLAQPKANQQLGEATHFGAHCVDVNGDRVDDVIIAAGAFFAGQVTEPPEKGVVGVWQGGRALRGPVGPTWQVDDATDDVIWSRGWIRFADVSGDGETDMLVPSPSGVAIYYGKSGRSGRQAPDRRLTPAHTLELYGGVVDILCVPFTIDDPLDIIVASSHSHSGAVFAGAIYAWRGGANTSTPTSTHTAPQPADYEYLGGS